ncbi:hypothetical protein PHYPO_G00005080 [Pangasianodon hypophthalmus]|uniref:Uncharacterized protein n=1 Tax=Pangasianodon hypophthalmus TaxID=310915 RepID=A0A5N5Q4K0_PANHP|nr:hypothetical protein PHYPO_G00005080 [Pangasianodon hypophthalmus]
MFVLVDPLHTYLLYDLVVIIYSWINLTSAGGGLLLLLLLLFLLILGVCLSAWRIRARRRRRTPRCASAAGLFRNR